MPDIAMKGTVDAENNRTPFDLSRAMAPLSLDITDAWDSAANEIRKWIWPHLEVKKNNVAILSDYDMIAMELLVIDTFHFYPLILTIFSWRAEAITVNVRISHGELRSTGWPEVRPEPLLTKATGPTIRSLQRFINHES